MSSLTPADRKLIGAECPELADVIDDIEKGLIVEVYYVTNNSDKLSIAKDDFQSIAAAFVKVCRERDGRIVIHDRGRLKFSAMPGEFDFDEVEKEVEVNNAYERGYRAGHDDAVAEEPNRRKI